MSKLAAILRLSILSRLLRQILHISRRRFRRTSVDTTTGPVEIDMPPSSARFGNALVIKDIAGHSGTSNVTIKAFGAEQIDGLPQVLIASDFGGYRLNPLAAGYTVSP